MSEVSAKVVEFKLEEHPNADSLSIARIKGTDWRCVVRTDQFKAAWSLKYHDEDKRIGIYIPIDSLVPTTREEFSFLDTKGTGKPHRVKTIKLRKVLSQGLLVPAPEGAEVGDDYTKELGIVKYEPPEPTKPGGGAIKNPKHFDKYTSIENYKNHPNLFKEGDNVRITLKIHGTNFRFGFVKENNESFLSKIVNLFKASSHKFHVGSHNVTKSMVKDTDNIYSSTAINLSLEKKLKPVVKELNVKKQFIVYGEIYGRGIQDLKYDALLTPKVRIFDVKVDGKFQPWEYIKYVAFRLGVETVPVLYQGPFSKEKLNELRDGKDPLGEHPREGVVITAEPERNSDEIGRVILKAISDEYLFKKNKHNWSDSH